MSLTGCHRSQLSQSLVTSRTESTRALTTASSNELNVDLTCVCFDLTNNGCAIEGNNALLGSDTGKVVFELG